MIKLFEVAGFKNFKDILTVDFSDVHDYQFHSECITDGLVGKMIVYGKNSVGKSNLGLAMFDLISHLTDQNVGPRLYDYSLNSENAPDHAWFHYQFQFGTDVVDYAYKKDDKRSLIFEEVKINQQQLFSYDFVSKTGELDGIKVLAPTLNLDFSGIVSVLRYLIHNSVLPEQHPLRALMRFVNSMLWFRNLDENRFIGYKNKADDYLNYIFEPTVLEEFQTFLHQAGITDKLVVHENADGNKVLYFDKAKPLPFLKTASSGTHALYTLFYWLKTAKDVSLLFIDEFDAYYHYELAEQIVKMLEQMHNTQVILTSHNTNLLSNRIMRPDCYFILSDGKLTSFVNATNRELREGHNLEKLYMSGEFNGS